MSEFLNLILKGLVKGLIIVTALLPFVVILFNFFATMLSIFPTFVSAYVSLGLGAFVIKFVVGWIND